MELRSNLPRQGDMFAYQRKDLDPDAISNDLRPNPIVHGTRPDQGNIGRALGVVGPSAAADVIAAAEARRTHVQRHGMTVVGRVGATF